LEWFKLSALIIKNVIKKYDAIKSVHDVSLEVEGGQIIALLGHNGAGKTTLMKMILGLTHLTSGSIEVLGSLPGSKNARQNTSYLPENVAFHSSLTGREQMHHFASLKAQTKKTADELLEKVGLTHAMNRRIGTYSKGMRQRVGLAQALLGKPKLALLDEPTSGLDPISRVEFYDIVKELADRGTAVLISSHALTELESRTNRIAILSMGKLVANDSLVNLRNNASLPNRIIVKTCVRENKKITASLKGKQIDKQTIELFCQQNDKVALLNKICTFGNSIKDVDIYPPDLEEIYRHYSLSKTGDL